MCRIAGIISKSTEPSELQPKVRAMCDSMKHGGPDDEGIYLNEEEGIYLGHRRLSLLDLTDAGHQPMSTADGKIWISYNGEIYNFKELRSQLEALGAVFRTATDTEVILKAYQHWGSVAFAKLEGMFAFALADRNKQITYLVRDAGGIKPLYYTIKNNDLIFASEVRAFKRSGYPFTEDENWKIYMLSFGYIPEPFTTLKEVQSLPKGNYLEWDNTTNSFKITEYFSYTYTEEIIDFATAVEQVRDTLTASVQRHLISDAPIGVFLSGGIDSSILTLVADQFQETNLNTLSINFGETEFNEKPYQLIVSNKTSGMHSEYRVTEQQFHKNFDTIIGSMDQPSNDGINSWFVSRCARKNGLKAVLSGIGADEYFGGYPSFYRMQYIAKLKRIPKAMLRLAENHSAPNYKRLSYLGYNNPVGEYLFLRGFFTPQIIAGILNIDKKVIDDLIEAFPHPAEIQSLSGGNRASGLETNYYMQNQLLKDTDYMSMSNGLEVRVPFLDQQLVKTVLSIGQSVKFNTKQNKALLIAAFKDLLPEAVWNRKKMGFTFPFRHWMKNSEQIANATYTRKAKQLMNQFKSGDLHWSKAFALYHVFNGK